MKTDVEKLYEAMFLVDSALAAQDWDGVNKTIKNILKRAKAEIISIKKWDERKLAYDINGQSRGTYILCYFKVNGQKIQDIERDAKLSEKIMRVLILNAEHLTQEDIKKQIQPGEKKSDEKVGEEKKRPPKKTAEDKERKEPETAEVTEKQEDKIVDNSTEAESAAKE